MVIRMTDLHHNNRYVIIFDPIPQEENYYLTKPENEFDDGGNKGYPNWNGAFRN